MKCIVEGCPEEAYDLVLFIGRFGAKQPHVGTWSGIWLCKDHQQELGRKLQRMGIKEKVVLSGLMPIPDEVIGIAKERTPTRQAPPPSIRITGMDTSPREPIEIDIRPPLESYKEVVEQTLSEGISQDARTLRMVELVNVACKKLRPLELKDLIDYINVKAGLSMTYSDDVGFISVNSPKTKEKEG